ncbi:NAD-dependent epimerase/dehydratase family protein [Acidocella sp.]|uniref:NAD-dependent epimerase/dehydratase family protein n=1 Tax=Acidocella sp. TaxID=50710 RepID=UPI003CFDFF9B
MTGPREGRPIRHLVVGGGGFIGRHVGLALARQGDEVILTGREKPGFFAQMEEAGAISWRDLDIYNADWAAQTEGADIVHFYAWGSLPSTANADPKADLAHNLGALLGMLDALRHRGHGRVVFSSSGGTVYGPLRRVPVPESHKLAPINAYGASKSAAEIYLNLYRVMYGLDCRVARIANPFGAGQDISRGLGAVTAFLNNALNNRPIEIWGTGEVVRDFIHIADVTDCLVKLAMTDDLRGQHVFNLGSGEGTSLNGIVEALEMRFGRKLEVSRKPGRAFDVPSNVLSINRVKRTLGWSPRLSFSAGLARMLADLAEHPDFSALHPAEGARASARLAAGKAEPPLVRAVRAKDGQR